MALVPWKKGSSSSVDKPVSALQREMNRLFDDFFSRDYFVEPFRGMGEWRPALDVSETETEIVIKAELPGLEAKDVEVSLSGDVLTLKGEKREEKEEHTKNVHRVERSYGSFQRSLRLPTAVKADAIEAQFKNGILSIHLPKSEQGKAKAIKIKPQ